MYASFTTILLVVFVTHATAFAEVFIGTAVIAGSAYIGPKVYCHLKECCRAPWIEADFAGLKDDLQRKVFGQHLATRAIYSLIKGHVENENPQKALVLSLHGWTGSGKNHVTKIIAKNLFEKGLESAYVHQSIATIDFPHGSNVQYYQRHLREFIKTKVKKCQRSLFIFDEVDKIPGGVLDALKPFLEHYQEIDGINYRRSIFIFISNLGANSINQFVIKHWRDGLVREEITMKQMDKIINLGAFNTQGGLWLSELIQANLIDYFVPFLPMERVHVKQCIEAELVAKNKPHSEEIIDLIAKELQYFPEDEKIFSKSGCKKVASRIDYIV